MCVVNCLVPINVCHSVQKFIVDRGSLDFKAIKPATHLAKVHICQKSTYLPKSNLLICQKVHMCLKCTFAKKYTFDKKYTFA